MDTKLICTVLSVLDFLSWEVTTGNGMIITQSRLRMTWLESFSYCSLASEESIRYLTDGEYRGWVGGIYLNSQWMIHKGCHSNSGSMNHNGVYDIKRLTPTLCSEKCKMNKYFALKYNWCLCLHSLYNFKEVTSSKCTYKCAGSYNDVCGERSHYTVYQHIIGKSKPKRDVDQRFVCSVIVPRNGTFVLTAVDCSLEYWTACVIYGVTRQMAFTTYQSAIDICSSLNGRILSTIDNLHNLEDGREYWSNIFRSKFLKWTTNELFDEICYEVDELLNVDCVHLTVKNRIIRYIPVPCKYQYKAICKPTKSADLAVTKKCQTKKITTARTKEEISTRKKPTSSTKNEKEETSAEETIFTSTSILTSTPERTDTAVLLSSTIPYKSTTFSAPSVPIKSTKVVASTIITKEEISTREISTSSANHEKEETLSEEISTEETSAEATPTEETSAEETKFRATSILTSSCESTDTSVHLASTIPYNSTTFSAPSVPIKSTKVVASTIITKEEISTREISTSSINHEKEETLSEETSTEETSAEETKFRSTSILTSSRKSTDTSVLLASKIPYKSLTFSATSVPIKSIKDVVSSMPIMSTKFDYTKFANGSSTKERHFSITSTFSIAVLVILIVFVLVCLQISLIGILRRHWRATQEVNQYELTSPFTEPRMYAKPEIHHYEVVDDIPS